MKIQLNARNCAHAFAAQPGEKVLLAGLRQGVALPYECASGTCGTCRARLVEGEIADAWPQAPGTHSLKGREEFLMCQCEARSDLTVEVAGFVPPLEPGALAPAAGTGRIVQSRLLARDVLLLSVRTAEPLAFDAGQFALVQLPRVAGTRAWSMANWEPGGCTLDFILKRKPGGAASELLFTRGLEAGLQLEFFGPLGRATFHPGIERDLLCIAGGSGIAGMLSILQRAVELNHFARHRGDVFFGVRTAADSFALETLSALVQRAGGSARLRVTVALSDEPVPAGLVADFPALRFECGLVHEVAQRGMEGRWQGLRAYLAGPPPAVDAAVRTLLRARVSAADIRYDKFA